MNFVDLSPAQAVPILMMCGTIHTCSLNLVIYTVDLPYLISWHVGTICVIVTEHDM